MVFTALEIELESVSVRPGIDHGPVLLQQVHEGTLDAAIITIAQQTVVLAACSAPSSASHPWLSCFPGALRT
ncbi:hypothetical protein Nm8I071_23830 [Nonomuraea sp. TT08I-71]|nr:hypothetical protein Nm8I071_23830 [Nonomuraea sp. TT08I-71]